MIKPVILALCLCLGGCTVFSPQDTLFPFLDEPIPLEKLNETVFVVGPVDVYNRCIALGVNPFLAVLGSPLFGCAGVYHAPDENGIYNCVIYQAYDWEWIYKHEHRHCLGYMD